MKCGLGQLVRVSLCNPGLGMLALVRAPERARTVGDGATSRHPFCCYCWAPPLMRRCCPLTQEARSLAKYSAASATFFGAAQSSLDGPEGGHEPTERVVLGHVGVDASTFDRRRDDGVDGDSAVSDLERK